MNGKFKVIPSVFVAAIRGGQVVLVKRKNTSFMDGYYDLPSGHLEPNETINAAAVRELHEETGLSAKEDSLELFNITQAYMTPGRPYLYMMFKTEIFSGEPSVTEPDLSDDVRYFGLQQLPENTVPHVKEALKKMSEVPLSFGYVAAE